MRAAKLLAAAAGAAVLAAVWAPGTWWQWTITAAVLTAGAAWAWLDVRAHRHPIDGPILMPEHVAREFVSGLEIADEVIIRRRPR